MNVNDGQGRERGLREKGKDHRVRGRERRILKVNPLCRRRVIIHSAEGNRLQSSMKHYQKRV